MSLGGGSVFLGAGSKLEMDLQPRGRPYAFPTGLSLGVGGDSALEMGLCPWGEPIVRVLGRGSSLKSLCP